MAPSAPTGRRTTLGALTLFAALTLRAATPIPDADDGGLILPPGFRALIVADKVTQPKESLRFLTVAPNGDVYAKSSVEGIYAMRDTNGDGRMDIVKRFGSGNGTGIALHDGWLYYSTTHSVHRYKYTPGELIPAGEPETIVKDLPDRQSHNSKAFAFDGEGRLLVETGSPHNVYSDPDRQFGAKGLDATEYLKRHGGYWRYDPDRQNQTQADGFHFSTGHRHSLSVAWHPVSREFFVVQMGRDNLNTVDPEHYDELDNAERVAEEFHLLKEGTNLGWPYTYWDPIKKARMVNPEFGGDNRRRDDNPAYAKPIIAFPAHWAPLQMCLYVGEQFPAKYRHGMFVAFHGSWNRSPRTQAGYRVAFIRFDAQGMPTGEWETFAAGFAPINPLDESIDTRHRPSGVAVGPDGSLYICETDKGRVWRVIHTGETASPRTGSAAVAAPAVALKDADTPGGRIYTAVCAACHMPDGSGVANMQPPLRGSQVVAGDSNQLIDVLLKGPAAVLPATREKYQNVMPPFGAVYSDQEIAAIINFVRTNFAPDAPPVTPEQVAAQRSRM